MLHFNPKLHGAGTSESWSAMLKFEEATANTHLRESDAPAFPYVLCGPQASAKDARAAIGKHTAANDIEVSEPPRAA